MDKEHCYNKVEIIVTLFKLLHPGKCMGYVTSKDDIVEVLEPFDIYRIFAAAGKVFAETNHGEYTLRLRLYEMEQRLDSNFFVRISNSDIINLRKVKGFDLSFAGTICVTLSNGTVTYVSRRFVAKIKQLLGI